MLIPKLFGELRERYAARAGGYTRVLQIESPKEDQARSAILELVDGPRDMRYNMTARTLARNLREKTEPTEITRRNMEKVTRFRERGMQELEALARRLRREANPEREAGRVVVKEKRKVYPEPTVVMGKDRRRMGLPWVSRKSLRGDAMEYQPKSW